MMSNQAVSKIMLTVVARPGDECEINIREQMTGCSCMQQRVEGKDCLEHCLPEDTGNGMYFCGTSAYVYIM